MPVRNYLGGCGSTFSSWIARVAPQHAVKLVEIVSTIAQLYSAAVLGRFVMMDADFTFIPAKSARSAVCI